MRRVLSLIFLLFVLAVVAFAQPGDPNGGNPPGGQPVPLSGFEWLLLSGAFFGARTLIRNVRKR